MAQHRPTDTLLGLIRQALTESPAGLAPRQLMGYLQERGEDISRPTLNRLLTMGVDQKTWSAQGKGRAVVYILGQVAPDAQPNPVVEAPLDSESTPHPQDGEPGASAPPLRRGQRATRADSESAKAGAGKNKKTKQAANGTQDSLFKQIQSVVWWVADTLRDKTGLQVEAYQPVTLALMILKRNLDIQAEQLRPGGRMAEILGTELGYVKAGLRTPHEVARTLNNVNNFWNPGKLEGDRVGLAVMTWADLSEFEAARNKAVQEAAQRGDEDKGEGSPVTLVMRANPPGHDTPETALFTYTTRATDLKAFVLEVIESLGVDLFEAFSAIGIHSVLDSRNDHAATLGNDVLRYICTETGEPGSHRFRDFDLGLKAVPNDLFSDVYMDLLGRFAEASGKRGGEYFTPTDLVEKLIRFSEVEAIAKELASDPTLVHRVADPTAGSNTFLIKFYEAVRNAAARIGVAPPGPEQFAFFAQELKNTQVGLGVFNMSYHGLANRMNLTEEEIRMGGRPAGAGGLVGRTIGNSISEYVGKIGRQAGRINSAFGNPPYGVDDYGITYANDASQNSADKRWVLGGGVPTRSEGEWAFLLTFAHLLADNQGRGQAHVVMPMGVLFRDGGAVFRKQMVENDWIEGIIATPANQFLTTSIPVCILILNKNKNPAHRGGVFFINASEDFTKVGKFNRWDEDRAVEAWQNRSEIPGYSGFVSLERLRKAPNYSLAVNRWFSPIREKKEMDPRKMARDVAAVQEALVVRGAWMENVLKQATSLWLPGQEPEDLAP